MNIENQPDETDYSNVVVSKPWGYEYLVYQNDSMAMWCLHLKKDEQTSMHCHPDKKTGLIVISGEIRVSFLNDSTGVKAVNKLMIRPGLFHSSKAVSENGAILFELENPVNKENLVRLEDNYGRKEKPYEGQNAMKPLSEDALRIPDLKDEEEKTLLFHGVEMKVVKTKNLKALSESSESELFAILNGGLISNTNDIILGPGDVVNPDIFKKLSATFTSPEGISLIRIKR